MPTFWSPTAPGIQKPGGVSWWAALNYAFKLEMQMQIGVTATAKSVGAFGLPLGGTQIAMDGQGVSVADVNLNLGGTSVGFTRPTPIAASLALPLGGTSMGFIAAERYSRAFALSMTLGMGFTPAGTSNASLALNLGGTQVNMTGVFVPLDPVYVGGGSAETNSIALSAHTTNDYILMWAFNDTNTTAITVPAGWTAVMAGAGPTCYGVLAYKKAASNAEVSGTWTNATGLVHTVYRNLMGIGASVGTQATSATVNYGAFTFGDVDPSYRPWVASFGAHRSVNGNMGIAPTGQTNRVNLAGTVQDMAAFDTNGAYASTGWPSTNVVTTETSSGYITASVELIPLNASIFENINLTNIVVPAGKSAKVTMRGAGAGGGGADKPSSGGYGAGGAGGGAWIKEAIIPPASLGATCSITKGSPGTGGAVTPTAGTAGGDSVFTSGATTLTAGGGKGGLAGGSGTSVGGAGGTVSNPGGFSTTQTENGQPGGNGSRTTNVAGSPGGDSTNAGPGGGGGGCNISSTSAGGRGGNSASTTGGTGGPAGGGTASNGGSPADAAIGLPGGGGGGGGAAASSSTAGLGGIGSRSGAGGGGGGGKEGTFGGGNAGQGGGDGYNKLEFV